MIVCTKKYKKISDIDKIYVHVGSNFSLYCARPVAHIFPKIEADTATIAHVLLRLPTTQDPCVSKNGNIY